MLYLGYFSISFDKITFYTEILTWKVELWIFSTRFTHEKTPQNYFSWQNFSVENNYFCTLFSFLVQCDATDGCKWFYIWWTSEFITLCVTNSFTLIGEDPYILHTQSCRAFQRSKNSSTQSQSTYNSVLYVKKMTGESQYLKIKPLYFLQV